MVERMERKSGSYVDGYSKAEDVGGTGKRVSWDDKQRYMKNQNNEVLKNATRKAAMLELEEENRILFIENELLRTQVGKIKSIVNRNTKNSHKRGKRPDDLENFDKRNSSVGDRIKDKSYTKERDRKKKGNQW